MRIVVVAPPWYEVPPRAYGGAEGVCFDLVEGLVSRGHAVTLIGAGMPKTDAEFVATFPVPPSGLASPERVWIELVHAAKAARAIDSIDPDLVHDHSIAGPLASSGRGCPTIATVHGEVGSAAADLYRNLPRDTSLVALSRSQRDLAPDLPWIEVVHNGIPVDEYPFRRDKDDFVLFLGRLSPVKGPDLAIDAARRAGLPIVLAARCEGSAERRYFEEAIEPRLCDGVTWLGEVGSNRKRDLLSRARCLVAPVRWDEPFGLVLIEALACGTPVVALKRGAIPEIVDDGTTGFVRTRPEELPDALLRVDEIDPVACRLHAERRFSVVSMVSGYERTYERVLARTGGGPMPSAREPVAVPA
jgi:glycosyltransferase involved in cell wall biosynthesis